MSTDDPGSTEHPGQTRLGMLRVCLRCALLGAEVEKPTAPTSKVAPGPVPPTDRRDEALPEVRASTVMPMAPPEPVAVPPTDRRDEPLPEVRASRARYWLNFLNDPGIAGKPTVHARVRRIIGTLRLSAVDQAELQRRRSYWRNFASDPAVAANPAIEARVAQVAAILEAQFETLDAEPATATPAPTDAAAERPLLHQRAAASERIAYWEGFLADLAPDADPSLVSQVKDKLEMVRLLEVGPASTNDGGTDVGAAWQQAQWLEQRLATLRADRKAQKGQEQPAPEGDEEEKNDDGVEAAAYASVLRRLTRRVENAFRQVVARLPASEALAGVRHDLGPCVSWLEANEDEAAGFIADLVARDLITRSETKNPPNPRDWEIHFAEPTFYPNLLFVRLRPRAGDAGSALSFAFDAAGEKPPTRLEGGPEVAYALNAATELDLSERTAQRYASMVIDMALMRELPAPGDGEDAAGGRSAEESVGGHQLECRLLGTDDAWHAKLLVTVPEGAVILSDMTPVREG